MSRTVGGWLCVLLVSLFAYGGWSLWKSYGQTAATGTVTAQKLRSTGPPKNLDEYQFINSDGQPLSIASLKGEVWAANFFFASCPGFCLQMNRAVAELAEELGPEGLKFVSLSIDPANDPPERLAEYAKMLGADPDQWLFLTGEFAEVQRLGESEFGITVADKAAHSDELVLVDRTGKIRGKFAPLQPPQRSQFKREVLKALAEQSPPANSPPGVKP